MYYNVNAVRIIIFKFISYDEKIISYWADWVAPNTESHRFN